MSGSGSGSKDNTRTEEFKRATAGVLRAIAQNNEVQVAFQPGPSGLAGKRARLPLPTRALPANEMAKLRGAADSLALRLRHHDDAVHNARMPARREAKDAYDAIEQARVEVVGAKFMSGVANNLRARLQEECEAEGFDRMTRKDQLPVHQALALLARERMSGEPSPPAAQKVLDLWRGTLGEGDVGALDAAFAHLELRQVFVLLAGTLGFVGLDRGFELGDGVGQLFDRDDTFGFRLLAHQFHHALGNITKHDDVAGGGALKGDDHRSCSSNQSNICCAGFFQSRSSIRPWPMLGKMCASTP